MKHRIVVILAGRNKRTVKPAGVCPYATWPHMNCLLHHFHSTDSDIEWNGGIYTMGPVGKKEKKRIIESGQQ